MCHLKLLLPLLLLASGCGIPHDPNDTFEKVQGGVIRAGLSEQSPWTAWTSSGGEGIEVQLLQEFADSCNARIEWIQGSESRLFEMLKLGQLDLVIGGLTTSTPWSSEAGLTQPYLKADDPITGETAEHVWAVPRGENRWLLQIDAFLQKERIAATPLRRGS
jgi:polar amino acid transport system substrate-binding protein